MTPSKYQQAIYDWVQHGSGNAVIEACAGSGKTTTIINALKLIPKDQSVLMLAFNATIAKELKSRVPAYVEAMTFHSLGFSALRKKINGLKIIEGNGKVRDIVRANMTSFSYMEFGNEVIDLVNFARRSGLLPDGVPGVPVLEDNPKAWEFIISHFDIDIKQDQMSAAIKTARETITQGIEAVAEKKIIDYDDQIYIPVVKGLSCNKYDWVFVDEAQDASTTRIALAEMSVKETGRLVAVGDRAQSIYGFTGSNSKAMSVFTKRFDAQVFPLSTCYRCAESIIEEAQKIVPTIESHDDAPYGSVIDLEKYWDVDLFEHGDLIICRKKAPLVNLMWRLVKNGIGCKLLGRDISSGLISIIRKTRAKHLIGTNGLSERLADWLRSELKELDVEKNASLIEQLNDKYDCIQSILEQSTVTTIDDLITSIDMMFADEKAASKENTITLCTVHKSKGLEAKRVFILNRHDMPSKAAKLSWQIEQEKNLIYVATTRAKENLFFIE